MPNLIDKLREDVEAATIFLSIIIKAKGESGCSAGTFLMELSIWIHERKS